MEKTFKAVENDPGIVTTLVFTFNVKNTPDQSSKLYTCVHTFIDGHYLSIQPITGNASKCKPSRING